MTITASLKSDDGKVDVDFDATPFFKGVGMEQGIALAKCGWGGDDEADAVAYECQEHDDKVAEFQRYIVRTGDGFECWVDQDDAMAWLKANRADLHHVLLVHPELDMGRSGPGIP